MRIRKMCPDLFGKTKGEDTPLATWERLAWINSVDLVLYDYLLKNALADGACYHTVTEIVKNLGWDDSMIYNKIPRLEHAKLVRTFGTARGSRARFCYPNFDLIPRWLSNPRNSGDNGVERTACRFEWEVPAVEHGVTAHELAAVYERNVKSRLCFNRDEEYEYWTTPKDENRGLIACKAQWDSESPSSL